MSDENELFEEVQEEPEAKELEPLTIQVGNKEYKINVLKSKPVLVVSGKKFSVRLEEIDGRVYASITTSLRSPLKVLVE